MRFFNFCLCFLLTGIFACQAFGAVDAKAVKARKEKLASRSRRVIWNNDGCELNKVLFKTHTPEFFNSIRNQGVIGKGVDVISFCTLSSGFGMTTARSEIADMALELPAFRDGLQALLDQGTDPLKATVEFSHANNLECYWSFRINDCHDAFRGSEGLFPEFKMKNPETMVGTKENPPPYGYWSAVDFSQKKVREMMFAMFKEIIDN